MKSIELFQLNTSDKSHKSDKHMNKSMKSSSDNSQLATFVYAVLMVLGLAAFTRPALATNPHEPHPTNPPAASTPVVNIPINVNPTAGAASQSSSQSTSGAASIIKTDIHNSTNSGPANSISGPANSISGPAITKGGNANTTGGNAITTGGDASVRGGSADITGGNSTSASGAATTAAGNVTSVLRTGDNSFLYLPNPATHPDVNITAGSYVYGGRVYIVCPTKASSWHITAYVLGGGASQTSDQMPASCPGLVEKAERIDAVGSLLSLLQYMDRDLQTAYASTAADRMLQIIGAQPVRRPAGGAATSSSSRQTETTTTTRERVIIREGAKVPGSN